VPHIFYHVIHTFYHVVAACDKKSEGVESNTDSTAYLIPTSMFISLVQKYLLASCHVDKNLVQVVVFSTTRS
jgi:hypothetical protein